MELWQAIGLSFIVLVVAAMAKEAARRLAFSLLAGLVTVISSVARGFYWLLIGWWFGMLRRWFAGSAW